MARPTTSTPVRHQYNGSGWKHLNSAECRPRCPRVPLRDPRGCLSACFVICRKTKFAPFAPTSPSSVLGDWRAGGTPEIRYINPTSGHRSHRPRVPVLVPAAAHQVHAQCAITACGPALLSFRFAQYCASSRWEAMAVAKYSGSSSGSAAMRASLVVMLLLGAVVAAHGRPVSFENKCGVSILVAGVKVEPGTTVFVDLLGVVEIVITDGEGKRHTGWYECPADVTALVAVYDREEGCVKVLVAAAGLISKLLHTVVGLVVCVVQVVL